MFGGDFQNQGNFQRQWDAFKRWTRLTTKQDFKDVFEEIGSFLAPLIRVELDGRTMNLIWKGKTRRWE